MRKLIVITVLTALFTISTAVEVTLNSGKMYSGTIDEAKDFRVVLQDGKVMINIPSTEIKLVMDGKKDITKDILGKANAAVQIDRHFIHIDDYFVAEHDPTGANWVYVSISKMLTPASPGTKNEGKFLRLMNGDEIWSKWFYRTRIANKDEIKVGAQIICLDYNENDIYVAPKDKQDTQIYSWFTARITDVSEMYKGYVMVSSGYKVAVDNIRISIK